MLLGFLMRSPMTGYELKKKFSISFSFFSGLSYGSIYPALKKMEREGLIRMKTEIRSGSPNRNVYTITDAGREAFLETLRSPFALVQPKNAFLPRLFFFGHLPAEERLAAAKDHLESVREVQRQLRSVEPQIKGRADKYQYLCFRFGVQFYQDLTRNVSRIVRELEKDGTKTEVSRRRADPQRTRLRGVSGAMARREGGRSEVRGGSSEVGVKTEGRGRTAALGRGTIKKSDRSLKKPSKEDQTGRSP